MGNEYKLFAEISKVVDNGDGTIDVHGIASTGKKDSQGEIVTKLCMEDAIPDYFMHGTGALRAMHQPIAAGYVYKAVVNAEGQTEISAKVVDPVEVLKVQTKTYKGFSIGGKRVPGGYDEATKTINKMKLTEISLVDRPANPEAVITMWKGEGMDIQTENEKIVDIQVTKAAEESIDKLAELVNKGAITPERLVELANAEIAKAFPPATTDEKAAKAKADEEDAKSSKDSEETKKQDAAKGDTDKAAADAKVKADADAEDEKSKKETDAEDSAKAETGGEIRKAFAEAVGFAGFAAVAKTYMPDLDIMGEMFMRKGTVEDIKEDLTEEVIKFGARNSKGDSGKIQAMHDHAVDLGAVCSVAEDMKNLANAEKADTKSDIKKIESLEAAITKLTDEHASMVKKVEELQAQPAPSKIVLRTVSKADDVGGNDIKDANGPVLKTDGSIDHEATVLQDIKKVHRAGGKGLLR